jgi:hypothetical protein
LNAIIERWWPNVKRSRRSAKATNLGSEEAGKVGGQKAQRSKLKAESWFTKVT